MDSINIKNAQGESININVVRYFRLNESEYLIFSLNEVDDGGYVKLYICKVIGNTASSITDDVEWNLIKDTIKTIIKSNKDNLPLSIIDINSSKLDGIQITDQKVFKLSETFISLLGANKKVGPVVEGQQSPQADINLFSMQNGDQVQDSIVQDISPSEPASIETSVVETHSSIENNGSPQIDQNIVQNSDSSISDGMDDYTLDYKTLYENELNKNKELTEKNENYQNIIDNMKKIIEEAL